MRSRSMDGRHIVRLESGDRVIDSLVRYLIEQDVGFAHLSATGALSGADLGFWDPQERAYRYDNLDEQLEVVSFQGNASLLDGRPSSTSMSRSGVRIYQSSEDISRMPACTRHSRSGSAARPSMSAE